MTQPLPHSATARQLLSEIKTPMATIHDAEIKLVQSELNMNLLKDVSDIV